MCGGGVTLTLHSRGIRQMANKLEVILVDERCGRGKQYNRHDNILCIVLPCAVLTAHLLLRADAVGLPDST